MAAIDMKAMEYQEKLSRLNVFIDALLNEWGETNTEEIARQILTFQEDGYDLDNYREE